MKPPAYVSIVLSPFIQLDSLDHAARQSITRAGLTIKRDRFFWSVIYFDEPPVFSWTMNRS